MLFESKDNSAGSFFNDLLYLKLIANAKNKDAVTRDLSRLKEWDIHV